MGLDFHSLFGGVIEVEGGVRLVGPVVDDLKCKGEQSKFYLGKTPVK